ncbi:hypothetical protein [Nostoc sp. PCC 9305]|uniref:hypothetical protein n=1 Tax=Nostoc sp. PCC 9305 TaxID=296636 RepID=UPI0039C6F37D
MQNCDVFRSYYFAADGDAIAIDSTFLQLFLERKADRIIYMEYSQLKIDSVVIVTNGN